MARSKISQFFETLSATIVAPFLITLVLTAQFFVQPAWAQAEEATAAALASDEADQAAEVADPPEIPADASAPGPQQALGKSATRTQSDKRSP